MISKFNHGGGTERVTAEISNGLIERGYDISIISCQKGLSPVYNVGSKVRLYSLHGEREKNSMKRKLSNLINLKKIVTANKIDVLITVDVELYIYAFPLQLMNLCKVIAWEHFNYYKKYNKLEGLSQKLAARYANKLIVLGKNDLKNYKENVKKLTNIEYIYNPISITNEQENSLNHKRVMAAGRLEEQKGFDMLIKAWKIVEENNTDWSLTIFGDGSQKEKLLSMINNFGLKRIEIKPYTQDIKKEYLSSDIYVMSSRYEGFGLVLLEAQECGLPIVSFDCHEGPSEIVTNNVNGYIIKDFSIKGLAKGMLNLINDPQLLHNFSNHSKDNLERFNLKDILDKWERVINEIK